MAHNRFPLTLHSTGAKLAVTSSSHNVNRIRVLRDFSNHLVLTTLEQVFTSSTAPIVKTEAALAIGRSPIEQGVELAKAIAKGERGDLTPIMCISHVIERILEIPIKVEQGRVRFVLTSSSHSRFLPSFHSRLALYAGISARLFFTV